MIDFRHRENVPASAISVVAIAVMFCTVIAFILVPKPKEDLMQNASRRAKAKSRLLTRDAEETIKTQEAGIEARTWGGSPDTVAPATLTRLNALAAPRKVNVTGFRPQRQTVTDGLQTVPFLLTIEGAYSDVIEFTRDIDKPANRIAVTLIQVSSVVDETGRVSATVGIVAYLKPEAGATSTTSPVAGGTKRA